MRHFIVHHKVTPHSIYFGRVSDAGHVCKSICDNENNLARIFAKISLQIFAILHVFSHTLFHSLHICAGPFFQEPKGS